MQTQTVAKTYADGVTRTVRQPLLEIFEPRNEKEVESGTCAGGSATCPVTGYTTPVERVREQMKTRHGGASDLRLLCAVVLRVDGMGRYYRHAAQEDLLAAEAAARELKNRRSTATNNVTPSLPSGKINHLRGFFNVVLYGMTDWGKLFSPREALTLIVLSDVVQRAATLLDVNDTVFAETIQMCLALVVDRQANSLTSLSRWNVVGEKIEGLFARQALPMVWDFGEANPFSESTGCCQGALEWVVNVCEQESHLCKHLHTSGQRCQLLQLRWRLQMILLTWCLPIHPTMRLFHMPIFRIFSILGCERTWATDSLLYSLEN